MLTQGAAPPAARKPALGAAGETISAPEATAATPARAAPADALSAALAAAVLTRAATPPRLKARAAVLARDKQDEEVSAAARAAAKRLIAAARKAEPEMTRLLQSAVEGRGALVGLAHNVKTEESLTRKLRDRATARNDWRKAPTAAVDDEASWLNDVLRYTVELPTSKYTAGYRIVVAELQKANVKLRWSGAHWGSASSFAGTYKGINATFVMPSGQMVEVQFHTAESWAMKSKTHELYEELRAANTEPPRRDEIRVKLKEMFGEVPTPYGAESIESVW